jgi:hypothetical protein
MERTMSKPWIIVASACGLMGLMLLTKQFRGGDSTSASASRTLKSFASTPRAERGGWLAVEGGGAAARSGGSEAGSGAAGGLDGGHGSSSDSGLSGSALRVGSGRGAGGTGFGTSAGYSGSNAIQAGAGIAADTDLVAGPGQAVGGAHGQAGSSGTGTQEVANKGDNSAGADAEDPNAPVLDLPLNEDNGTQPNKGSNAAIDENVNCGGVGQGCVFDADSQFAVPDAGGLSGDSGSISFCLQPQWAGGDQINASLVDLQTPNVWSNHLKVFKNGDYFRFSLWPSNGPEAGVSANIRSWQPGQWHPVTVTYGPDPQTGQNMMSMYLDGTLIGQQPYDSQLQIPNQPLYIGSDMPGTEPSAGGSLMNFQAYNRVLGPNDITNFAGGCPQ